MFQNILFLFTLFSAPLAFADASTKPEEGEKQKTAWFAQVNRSQDAAQRIPELVFSNIQLPVSLMPKEGKLRPLVEVKGSLKIPGAKLYISDQKKLFPLESEKEFTVFLYLNANISELVLQIQRPDGTKQDEKVLIIAPDIQEYRIAAPWGELMLSIGGGNFKYRQTSFGDFVSLTGLLSAAYLSPETSSPFRFYGDLDLSVWTIKSSPVNTSPQIMRFQGSATYSLLDSGGKFKLAPLAGVQYLTMFKNGSEFGFSNLIAPELGFRAKYLLRGGNYLNFRFVYLPLGGVTDFTHIGTDFYLGWSLAMQNRHRLEIGLSTWNQSYMPTKTTDVYVGFLFFKVGYTL